MVRMNIITYIILFVTVILVYLNILDEWKQGHDLEIYEYDYSTHYELQKILRKKQPVLFELGGPVLPDAHQLHSLQLDTYATKYGKEYVRVAQPGQAPVRLRLQKALELIHTDKERQYISYGNDEFVADSSMERIIGSLDEFLKPRMALNTAYDFVFGSALATTPLRSHSAHSGFLYVLKGQITIKLTPAKNAPLLTGGVVEDRGFHVSPRSSLWTDPVLMEAVPTLEFQVPNGWALYIPPGWWYTYQLHDLEPPVRTDVQPEWDDMDRTLVCEVRYKTVINTALQLPKWLYTQLQEQGFIGSKDSSTKEVEESQEPVRKKVTFKDEPSDDPVPQKKKKQVRNQVSQPMKKSESPSDPEPLEPSTITV
jgi:hypothetical protein